MSAILTLYFDVDCKCNVKVLTDIFCMDDVTEVVELILWYHNFNV